MSGKAQFGTKWTPADEAQFQQLSKQREEVRSRHESGVRIVASSIRRAMVERMQEVCPDRVPTETEAALALSRAMILHAEALRDALEPYDSGVREIAPMAVGS